MIKTKPNLNTWDVEAWDMTGIKELQEGCIVLDGVWSSWQKAAALSSYDFKNRLRDTQMIHQFNFTSWYLAFRTEVEYGGESPVWKNNTRGTTSDSPVNKNPSTSRTSSELLTLCELRSYSEVLVRVDVGAFPTKNILLWEYHQESPFTLVRKSQPGTTDLHTFGLHLTNDALLKF